MGVAKGNSDATHELVDLSVHEVSLVTAAANKREFLVVKADTTMRGQLLKNSKSTKEQVTEAVAALQSIDPSSAEGQKELRTKALALAEMLKEGEPAVATPAPEAASAPVAAPAADVAKAAPSLDALLVSKGADVAPDLKQLAATVSALTQVVAKMQVSKTASPSNAAEPSATTETPEDHWAEFDRKKTG